MSELIDSIPKRPSFKEYEHVFARLNSGKTAEQLKAHYESCRDRAAEQLVKHPFWLDLTKEITDWDAQYCSNSNAESLYKGAFADQAKLNKKSWASAFGKAYRKNVLSNANWPDEPEKKWIKSDCWFQNIGDILRTQFICRYIDGVQFIASNLEKLALKHGLQVKNQLQATSEGYYAGHVDITFEFKIFDMEFNSIDVIGKVEFQITTQLKEVVKQLLHIHYESKRLQEIEFTDTVWQWDYKKPSFDANYLGHVIHYLEAQILKLRDNHVT